MVVPFTFDPALDKIGTVKAAAKRIVRAMGVPVNVGVNAALYGLQRNTGVFPGFDERPIERGEEQDGSAAALEVLLDVGEVIEVVFQATGILARRKGLNRKGRKETLE